MIEVNVDDTVSDRLAAMGDAVRAALLDTTDALVANLTDVSAALLPDGPLRDSLNATITTDETGVAATIGSGLPYAGAVDQGFAGFEQVRDSLRQQSVAFGRPMTPREVLVRAHSRIVDIPGRHYLSAPFAAMQDDIAETYRSAVGQALDAQD